MKIISVIALSFLIFGCSGDENLIPKPPTYLRLQIPESKAVFYDDSCPYRFELPSIYSVNAVSNENCHKDIDLGPLNGIIHFSYIDMIEPLSVYVNFSNDKVDEHKIKATSIEDQQIIRSDKRVFGTFFELKGDVASPFQFYLTDSTDRFVSAVVYFNSHPNYDSLKPTLDYLKKDLLQMIKTFEWKKK
jgi:gliding motility-associated lipoprotein GldD